MTNATIRCLAELRTGYPDLLSSPNITGLNSDSFRNKARCTKYRIAAKHSINKLNDWVSTRKLPCCSLLLSSFLQRLKSLCQRIKVVFWGCSIRRRGVAALVVLVALPFPSSSSSVGGISGKLGVFRPLDGAPAAFAVAGSDSELSPSFPNPFSSSGA